LPWARQQFVGLASKFGTVALGRQYAPGFNATANNDALDASDFGIQSSLSAIYGMTITPNSAARFDNAITYTSNDLSGFKISAIYGFGETKSDGKTYNDKVNSTFDGSKVGIGLNYANGPINLDAVYQSRLSFARPNCEADPKFPDCTAPAPGPYKIPGSSKSINEWYVGGSYDFKVVKIFGSYQALENNNNIIATDIDNSDLWSVGVSAPIGRGTLGLELWPTEHRPQLRFGRFKLGRGHTVHLPALEAHLDLWRLQLFQQQQPGPAWPGDCCSRYRRCRRRKQLCSGCGHHAQLLKSRRSVGKMGASAPVFLLPKQVERTTEEQTSRLRRVASFCRIAAFAAHQKLLIGTIIHGQ
jgi:hypothetical protein